MLHKVLLKIDIQLELYAGQSKILGGQLPIMLPPGYVPEHRFH